LEFKDQSPCLCEPAYDFCHRLVDAYFTFLYHIPFTHCGRVTQICVFNTVKLGTSTSSP